MSARRQRSERVGASAGNPINVAWVVAIVAATLVAYLPAIHGGFIWDDDRYVTANPVLESAGGLAQIWTRPGATVQYYPLVFTSFWIERHLWGDNPLGYHAVNVAIHAASAVLLYLLLLGLGVPGAPVAAAAFALHPVHVESVAWITERKNVLSGFFTLAAAIVYARGRGWFSARGARPLPGRAYAAVCALFLCALLSKTVACTLPAALIVVAWWKLGRIERDDLRALVPLLALGAAFGIGTAWLEKHNVGASGRDWALSFADRILIAGRAPWFYAGKLLVPARLTFIYPRWTPDASSPAAWLYPAATAGAIALLWRLRARIGRAPLAASLLFCGTLFPALGFIDTYPMRYSFVADHFQYLASIPLLALAAAFLTRRLGRPAAAAPLLIALAFLTWKQGAIYRNLETLYGDTLRKNPGAWMAHNNLGALLVDAGRLREAEEHYATAIRQKEDFHEAHNNLGLLLVRTGRIDEALPHFERAVALRPDIAWLHANLGDALSREGRTEEAAAQFDEARRLNPLSDGIQGAKAGALLAAGHLDEAAAAYREAAAASPGSATLRNNLANVLAQQGKLEEAFAEYEAALRLDPRLADTYVNYGDALLQAGRVDEAIARFTRGCEIAPQMPRAHYKLGAALTRAGRLDEAIVEFGRVVELNPADADTRCNIGLLQSRLGRRDLAIAAFEAALRANPSHAVARRALEAERAGGSAPPPR